MNPDYELLQQYFLPKIEVYVMHTHFQDKEYRGFYERFEKLLLKYQLKEHYDNLFAFATIYSFRLSNAIIDSSFIKRGLKFEGYHYKDELYQVIEFFKNNDTKDDVKIKISLPKDNITISSRGLVTALLEHLEKISSESSMKPERMPRIDYKDYFQKTYALKKRPDERSPFKHYAKGLYPLFMFLREQTTLSQEAKITSIRFITELVASFLSDVSEVWQYFSKEQEPEYYLQDVFKNIHI